MIEPLPTPEDLAQRLWKNNPRHHGYTSAEAIYAIREDRRLIANIMEETASRLEKVIESSEFDMPHSRGAVDALRIMIATLAPIGMTS